MRYKAVIFDLDGVLVHTDEYHYQAWKVIADKLNIPFNESINNRLRGVSRMESLEIILSYGDKQFTEAQKASFADEKNNIYRGLLENLSSASVDNEVIKTLDSLRAADIALAIGSSSKNAGFILNKTGITHYFSAIVSGLDIARTKPDPEVFLKAAEQLGLAPKDCLVVEDAHAGVEAAHRGGFDCVGMGDADSSELAMYKISGIGEVVYIVKGD